MSKPKIFWSYIVVLAVIIIVGLLTFRQIVLKARNYQSTSSTTGLLSFPSSTTYIDISPSPTPPGDLINAAIEFIASRENIVHEELDVRDWEYLTYTYIGKSYLYVSLEYSKDESIFHVLVDTNDKSIHELIEVETADESAKTAKYGKLEPALYDQLQRMDSSETIKVAISVAGETKHNQAEIYAILASHYPEVQAAMRENGDPFSLGDYELANEVKHTYVELWFAEYRDLVNPLVEFLEGMSIKTETLDGMPVVLCSLDKDQIQEMVKRTDVGMVYLANQLETPAMTSDR